MKFTHAILAITAALVGLTSAAPTASEADATPNKLCPMLKRRGYDVESTAAEARDINEFVKRACAPFVWKGGFAEADDE